MIHAYGVRFRCDNEPCGAIADRGPLPEGSDWWRQPLPAGWLDTQAAIRTWDGRPVVHLCPRCAELPVTKLNIWQPVTPT